jgi:hypothetical protein
VVIEATELATSDDVKVQVWDRLATAPTDIGGHPVAVGDALFVGNPAGQTEASRQQVTVLLGEFVNRWNVLDGYDESVNGRLGELVAYSDDTVISADVLGRLIA